MKKNKLLFRYGRDILESEYFVEAEHQVHHLHSTVASHSINTALVCIVIYCILKRFQIKLNLSVLISAALAHDLGMIGRDQKYSSNAESYHEHPAESVAVLKMIRPKAGRGVCEAIATHMYPVNAKKPVSKEGWVLCIADKLAACTDWFCHYDLLLFP